MNTLQKTVAAWEAYGCARFRERESAVRAFLLALTSNLNAFLLGPPGTGKSLLCETMTQMLTGARYFGIQLFAFSTPEDLFGPVSMKGLEQDDFRRVTTGFFPDADVAFIDEVFRGEEGILSGLLWPLSSRQFKNGAQLVKMPLKCCIGASNTIPEGEGDLAALYDRFVIRDKVEYIESIGEWEALLLGENLSGPAPAALPISELATLQAEVANLPVADEVGPVLRELKHALNGAGIQVSDRKWMQTCGRQDIHGRPVASLMKAEAWLNGRAEVTKNDLSCLNYALWRTPDEIEKVVRILGEYVNPFDRIGQDLLNKAQEVYGQVAAIQPGSPDRETLLLGVVRQLRPLEAAAHRELSGGRDPKDRALRKVAQALVHIQRMKETVTKLVA